MKCSGDKVKVSEKERNTFINDVSNIIRSIIKHQELDDDTCFPFDDDEVLVVLEANFVWIINNIGIPFEKWKELFKHNPKYVKRLSDISMTYSFEEKVKNGEAVELPSEGLEEKSVYMEVEKYEKIVGEMK